MAFIWHWVSSVQAPVAVVIGVICATTGWIYTARRSRSLFRKQHTFNALLQASFNEKFQECAKMVRPHIRGKGFPDLFAKENEKLHDAVIVLLNHYEFVAAGIRNGDIAERLFKDSECSSVTRLFSASTQLIAHLREERKNRAIFEHLDWVYDRWEERPPSLPQKIIEWAVARPLYHPHYRWWCWVTVGIVVLAFAILWLHLPGEAFNPRP